MTPAPDGAPAVEMPPPPAAAPVETARVAPAPEKLIDTQPAGAGENEVAAVSGLKEASARGDDPGDILKNHAESPAGVDGESFAQGFVRTNLAKWDEANAAPDSVDDPAGFARWTADRVGAKQSFTLASEIYADLNQWDAQNPRPDRTTDPDGFDKWTQARVEKTEELTQKHSSEKPAEKTGEQPEGEPLDPQVQAQVDRALALSARSDQLIHQIIQFSLPTATPEQRAQVPQLQAEQAAVDKQVKDSAAEIAGTAQGTSFIKRIATLGLGLGLVTAIGIKKATENQ